MNTLRDHSALYQLPAIYKKKEGKHTHRLFIFLKSTDDVIRAVAAEAALCDRLEVLKLWFEMGITEADVQRYLGIFDAALPAEQDVEIEYEADIPPPVLRQWYQYAEIEATRRRALLN